MQEAIRHGWSRNILVHQIESHLYERQGVAITNFELTLPPAQSDLARQTLKDPYIFDFLQLGAAAQERDLEHGLLHYVRDFLQDFISICCCTICICAASWSLTSRSAISSQNTRAR